jgi:hypothetical protein
MNSVPSVTVDLPLLAAWATVIASLLALIAILFAIAQGRSNARQIAHERYLAVQIELLKDLIDIINGAYLVPKRESTGTAGTLRWRAAHARLRVVDHALPFTRLRYSEFPSELERMTALGVPAGPDNINDKPISGTQQLVRDRMYDELTEALSQLAVADGSSVRRLQLAARRRRSR